MSAPNFKAIQFVLWIYQPGPKCWTDHRAMLLAAILLECWWCGSREVRFEKGSSFIKS